LPEAERIKRESAIQQASGEVTAKATAERQQDAITALPTVVKTADESIALIDDALNHPGRETATGMSGMIDPRNYWRGSDAKDFGVRLDQIKGQAFLQAFQSLRGGGAITEREGQAATNAIARLNTAQSDAEFEKSLKDLRKIADDAKRRAIERATGGVSAAPSDSRPRIRYDAKGNRIP
jgi:hypothetical protein